MEYMLDTNTVSYFLRGEGRVSERVVNTPVESLCISAITKAEFFFGLARRPEATKLRRLVEEFLLRVEVLAWDSEVAEVYGSMRANLQNRGRRIKSHDMLIAAHALAVGVVLVTSDSEFHWIENLGTRDWRSP
ncbi:MAG: type II toxin-antitoxin system VapC family toxin [Desulfohalobiaceae bacterium]|nr:type II toxin-antitoxin system VapC family toxin [Desulfohalobiaceae bacterium]